MRICLYTETALPKIGGQEMVVDALARQFLALGHHVVVFTQPPRRPIRTNDAAFPYQVVRHPRFVSTRRFVGWYRHWLEQLQRRERFDVLHCHSTHPCGYLAALSKRKLRIPTVITDHIGDVWGRSARYAKPGMRQRHATALESADAVVSISRFTTAGYHAVCPGLETLVEIPNGVDLQPFAQQAARPENLDAAIVPQQYLLFLGRLHEGKGVDVLLRALRSVDAEAPGVQLVIAGDGVARPALESLTTELNLSHRVRFVGSVSGTTKTFLLQQALGVVVPSRKWESFGLVALEGYAAGRPVIASNLPGLGDLVQVGKTGLLVSPGSETELANALRQFLGNRAETERLGTNAREAAQQYAWSEVARRHILLYETVMAPRTARASA
ncbi:MAG: hypothetical protein C0483_03085 [Pirellula sp.]|nr:hypothetical protein [Pirellula sp.]